MSRLLSLAAAVFLAGCATIEASGGSGAASEEPPAGGGQALPPGWPDDSARAAERLAPFLRCASPAEFLALQRRVDMPRLVASLDDWRAVRLGAQGPLVEEAAGLLNHKRASFLLQAIERHGTLRAEVLALFIVDTAHDDDLRELLLVLARDKQLTRTLDALPSFRAALEGRGLHPTALADRDFEWKDLGRGLARAGRDALSSSPLSADAATFHFSVIREQLPPAYQEALDGAEKRWTEQHFAVGQVALGSVDHLTFGVPLGFYGLLAGTGQGVSSLARGEYEQATRELAPAALLVALYAGGRGARALSGWESVESRWTGLQETARRLEARLGAQGLRELAQYLLASREAGRFVAVGGVDAALALHEARGDVARARPFMAEAKPGAAGASPVKSGAGKAPALVADEAPRPLLETPTSERTGGLASLVDGEVGLTREVVEARLTAAELESTSPRLPRDVAVLEMRRPALEAPPPSAQGNPRWREYVGYYEERLAKVRKGRATKGPLPWAFYEQLRGWFARGLAFERVMVKRFQADARLPRAERRFLGDFDKPRIETNVGVEKPATGLRYADVLVVEAGEDIRQPRRVETFSFKSRDLSNVKGQVLESQMITDAREALRNYGETLDIRRSSLRPFFREGSRVLVQRVHLVYEGDALLPKNISDLDAAVNAVKEDVPGVEVLFP